MASRSIFTSFLLLYVLFISKVLTQEQVIFSYSMPVGQATKDGKLSYKDTSYNGVVVDGFYKNGTGILTDGKRGVVKFTEKFKGERYVGWSSFLTKSQYIDIIFEFSAVRKFTNVTLHVHVETKHGHAVFNQSQIFFSSTKDGFSDTSLLQCYTTREYQDRNVPYQAHVTLSLCENTARFIKLRLYFGGQWLLITEISFNSATSAPSSPPGLWAKCQNCSSGSSNLQLTFIIICVILLIVIVLLVVIFLLYRKRAQDSQTEKEKSSEPEAIQNNQEPDYNAADNVAYDVEDYKATQAHEEVQISPPSVSAQLDRNLKNETNEDTSDQKWLKYDPDYVIPADTNAKDKVVGKISQSVPAGYTELDNTKRVHDSAFYQKLLKKEPDYRHRGAANGTVRAYEEVQISPSSVSAPLEKNRKNETNEDTNQKWLKYDPDYVIPADTDAKDEVVGKIPQSVPAGYTELDNRKRVHDMIALFTKN